MYNTKKFTTMTHQKISIYSLLLLNLLLVLLSGCNKGMGLQMEQKQGEEGSGTGNPEVGDQKEISTALRSACNVIMTQESNEGWKSPATWNNAWKQAVQAVKSLTNNQGEQVQLLAEGLEIPIEVAENSRYSSDRSQNTPIRLLTVGTSGCSSEATLKTFQGQTNTQVSVHYVIDGSKIYQCVEPKKKAWYNGISSWQGDSNTNNFTLAVSLAFIPHNPQNGNVQIPGLPEKWFAYPELPDIVRRFFKLLVEVFELKPLCVVGLSEVATTKEGILGRQAQAPGPLFKHWKALAAYGVSAWPDLQKELTRVQLPQGTPEAKATWVQKMLTGIGYSCPNLEKGLQRALRMFQLHYYQCFLELKDDWSNWGWENKGAETIDDITIDIIAHLVDQYCDNPTAQTVGTSEA